ncbi:flagellar motor switch protein FliG [Alphaproteobacteria bacterium]
MLSGVEKVAVLLMMVKAETAKKVVGSMDGEEISLISQTMARLGSIDSEKVEKIVIEFIHEINDSLSVVGNVKIAEKFLKDTVSEDKEKFEQIMNEVKGVNLSNIWERLGTFDEQLIANFLKSEYPQTTAIIIAKIPSARAAKILASFSQEYALEVMKRMLSLDEIKREALEKLEKMLQTEFSTESTRLYQKDNNKVLAEIFDNLDRKNEAKLMSTLEAYSNEAAKKVKKWMFTFDDLAKIDAYNMQTLIRTIDKSKLAIALRGASQKIQDAFVRCMSQRAAKLLLEEIDTVSSGVTGQEMEEARLGIINVAKDMIAKGFIKLEGQDASE